MSGNGNNLVDTKVCEDKEFKVSGWGVRHAQCLLFFFYLSVTHCLRACMGVSIVAMATDDHHRNTTAMNIINDTDTFVVNNTDINATVSFATNINGTNEALLKLEEESYSALMLFPPYPKFKWSKRVQDAILSSFFFGYMFLQIPSGQLANKYGSRYLLFGAMIINGVVSFFMPWGAYYGGWVLTVICRILQGMAQAVTMPALHTFFGKWATLEERGRLSALTYGGQALGLVLGLTLTGFIAASPLGWPGIFRVYGVLAIGIGLVVWYVAADTPAEHPKISTAERLYIEQGLGLSENSMRKNLPVPWSKMLRSKGVYAIIVAHVGQTWCQTTLYTEVPAYMDKIMGVNIKANGVLSALPFLVMLMTNGLFSWCFDMLIVKKYFSVTTTRKIANSVGSVFAAFGLLILAVAPKNIYISEGLLVFICAFKIANHVGFMLNHIDISPNFAGTIMSLSNFTSNFFGSLSPMFVGYILTDPYDEHLWKKVFMVAAGIYFASNMVYVFLGTAEKAEWDEPVWKEEKKSNNVETGKELEPMLVKPTS